MLPMYTLQHTLSGYFGVRLATLSASAVPVCINNYAKARTQVLSSDGFCNLSNPS